MGRELKRVPLDFAWPIGKVWEGYVNPHYRECAACGGTGATAGSRRLREIVNLLMVAGEDATRGRNHPYFTDGRYFDERLVPSPDLAAVTGGLAGRPPRAPFGHDSIDSHRALEAIVRAAGLDPASWGTCPDCDGDGVDAASRAAYEAWEKTEPTAGDGYQLWETVSEGSPVSAVYPDAEAFVAYLRTEGYSDHAARRFVDVGWAPSMAMSRAPGRAPVMGSNIAAYDVIPDPPPASRD